MPQIILEYTENIQVSEDFSSFLLKIHQIIHSICSINIDNCKTRVVSHNQYFIGKGDLDKAFIHLEVIIFEGRSNETKTMLGENLITLLKDYFEPKTKNVDITVYLNDIKKREYFKYSSNSY